MPLKQMFNVSFNDIKGMAVKQPIFTAVGVVLVKDVFISLIFLVTL